MKTEISQQYILIITINNGIPNNLVCVIQYMVMCMHA